jgi:hypothetical protein
MLSSVEAWWVGLCARPFDGAQGDTHLFGHYFSLCFFMGYYFQEGSRSARSPFIIIYPAAIVK